MSAPAGKSVPSGRMSPLAPHARRLATVLVVSLAASCSSSGATSSTTDPPADTTALVARIDEIDAAIAAWGSATDIAAAHAAAEAARNLVVGAHGPHYGDADGDGQIGGTAQEGLLPGLDGSAGLADPSIGPCLDRDVLGGSWSDPAARWNELDAAIAAWTPTNNTFPALASHPQRIVGWASLTLATDDLATALEYAGHAHLHIDVASSAVADC